MAARPDPSRAENTSVIEVVGEWSQPGRVVTAGGGFIPSQTQDFMLHARISKMRRLGANSNDFKVNLAAWIDGAGQTSGTVRWVGDATSATVDFLNGSGATVGSSVALYQGGAGLSNNVPHGVDVDFTLPDATVAQVRFNVSTSATLTWFGTTSPAVTVTGTRIINVRFIRNSTAAPASGGLEVPAAPPPTATNPLSDFVESVFGGGRQPTQEELDHIYAPESTPPASFDPAGGAPLSAPAADNTVWWAVGGGVLLAVVGLVIVGAVTKSPPAPRFVSPPPLCEGVAPFVPSPAGPSPVGPYLQGGSGSSAFLESINWWLVGGGVLAVLIVGIVVWLWSTAAAPGLVWAQADGDEVMVHWTKAPAGSARLRIVAFSGGQRLGEVYNDGLDTTLHGEAVVWRINAGATLQPNTQYGFLMEWLGEAGNTLRTQNTNYVTTGACPFVSVTTNTGAVVLTWGNAPEETASVLTVFDLVGQERFDIVPLAIAGPQGSNAFTEPDENGGAFAWGAWVAEVTFLDADGNGIGTAAMTFTM